MPKTVGLVAKDILSNTPEIFEVEIFCYSPEPSVLICSTHYIKTRLRLGLPMFRKKKNIMAPVTLGSPFVDHLTRPFGDFEKVQGMFEISRDDSISNKGSISGFISAFMKKLAL